MRNSGFGIMVNSTMGESLPRWLHIESQRTPASGYRAVISGLFQFGSDGVGGEVEELLDSSVPVEELCFELVGVDFAFLFDCKSPRLESQS